MKDKYVDDDRTTVGVGSAIGSKLGRSVVEGNRNEAFQCVK